MMKPWTQILVKGVVFSLLPARHKRKRNGSPSVLGVSNDPARRAGAWGVHPAVPKTRLPMKCTQ